MDKQPLLSIAIPAYNVQEYLEKCLSSLLDAGQTGLLDVIIINDGSTDGTSEIADRFCKNYPHIFKLINKENGGHGSGIMVGIKHALGKYYRIIDADDWADTDSLKVFIEKLSMCDSDIVITPFTLVDMKTGKKRARPIPPKIKLDIELHIDKNPELYHYYDIHCLTVKTELLRKLNIELPLKTFYEDSEYVMKAVSGADTVTCFSQNVYQYLVGNVSQSMDARKMVERYAQHDLVLHRMVEAAALMPKNKEPLNAERIRTLALKQLIIGLIYDDNRKRGRMRANNTMKLLSENNPDVWSSLREKHRLLVIFNLVGVKVSVWEKLKVMYQNIRGN